MTEEGVIASLALSSGEAISDCFASLATAKNAAGLLRFARSDRERAPRSDRRETPAVTKKEILAVAEKGSR
jgi:hypothetical protein